MGLAISCSAANGSPYAGCVLWIDPVHVERDVIARGASPCNAEGLFHDGSHTALVNVAHGQDLNACAANIRPLYGVNVAYSHQHTVLRAHFRREVENIRQ